MAPRDSKPKRRAPQPITLPSPKRQRLASDESPRISPSLPSSVTNPLEPASSSAPHPTPVIDHAGYPHIIDAILENPNREFLISLRASSREFLQRCTPLFYNHLVFRLLPTTHISIEAPDGRIPGFEPRNPSGWWDDSESILEALSLARIIDVHSNGINLRRLFERLRNYTKPDWVRTFNLVNAASIVARRYIHVFDLTRFTLQEFRSSIRLALDTEKVVLTFKYDLRRGNWPSLRFIEGPHWVWLDDGPRWASLDDVAIHLVEQNSDIPLHEGGGEWVIGLIQQLVESVDRVTLVDIDKVPPLWLLGPRCKHQDLEKAIKWRATQRSNHYTKCSRYPPAPPSRTRIDEALNLVSAEQYMVETGITKAHLEVERGN